MAIILCHKSALQALRLIPGDLPAPCLRRETKNATTAKPRSSLPTNHPLIDFSLLDRPIQIVNNSNTRPSNTPERELHRWKTFPAGTLLHLGGEVYIPTPELLFTQLATTLPLIPLICIGLELCGTYPAPANETFDILKQTPRTSVKQLANFIKRNPGLRGVAQARKALPHIADGSASPMETATFLRLALPCRLGGCGLPHPQLNHVLTFSAKEAAMSKRSRAVCDLYWPEAKLAVEYDSDFHTGSAKIAKDAARRNALLLKGVKVITVTKNQMFVAEEFDKTAKVIAHELNIRIRPQCTSYENRKANLIKIVLQGKMFDSQASFSIR